MHLSCMNGCPLIRTLIVGLILVAAAFGLHRLTASSGQAPATGSTTISESTISKNGEFVPARVRLILSVIPSLIKLQLGEEDVSLVRNEQGEFDGAILLSSSAQVMFLNVKADPSTTVPGTHVFAKLVIEPDGSETITHVFDASGEIDDFLELKL